MLLLATILSSGTGAIEASAQTPDAGIDQSAAKRPWWLLWSRTSRENRVLWAMWTLHIHHVDDGISNDNLVGVMYRGGYAATFITTHGPRGYTLGLERNWVSGERGPLAGMLGFRAGLLYGYDERLGWWRGNIQSYPFSSRSFTDASDP